MTAVWARNQEAEAYENPDGSPMSSELQNALKKDDFQSIPKAGLRKVAIPESGVW